MYSSVFCIVSVIVYEQLFAMNMLPLKFWFHLHLRFPRGVRMLVVMRMLRRPRSHLHSRISVTIERSTG